MKKRVTLLTVVFAMASMFGMALPAVAADLHAPHQGTVCNGTVCEWHFVNNQTGGDSSTDISTTFTNVTSTTITKTKVLRKVVHYWVRTEGTAPQVLVDASTANHGRLVLSDFSCVCGCGCTG